MSSAKPLIRPAGLLSDEVSLHGVVLLRMLLKELGPGYITWDLEALKRECEERYGDLGRATWEKIAALVVLQAHDAFWQEWEVFENISVALSHEVPIFGLTQPLGDVALAVALTTARDVNKDNTYSDEVKRYIVACCLNDGLWYLKGTPMEFCQDVLDDYLKTEERDVPTLEVAALLETGRIPSDDENPAVVQAGRVRDLQKSLALFAREIQQQMQRVSKR